MGYFRSLEREVVTTKVERNADAITRNCERIDGVEIAVKETRAEVLAKIDEGARERREDLRDIDAKLLRIERKLDH